MTSSRSDVACVVDKATSPTRERALDCAVASVPARRDSQIPYRKAFTLLELMLVLSIIAVALGIAVPTYQAMIIGRRIHNAAETIELAVRQTRLTAMRTGQNQVMQFAIGGNEFTTASWISGEDAANAAAGATLVTGGGQVVQTDTTGAAVATPTAAPKTLPEGIIFAEAAIIRDLRSVMQTGVAGGDPVWSEQMLFYPDGSTSTARIVLQSTDGHQMAVGVRGINGEPIVVALPGVTP